MKVRSWIYAFIGLLAATTVFIISLPASNSSAVVIDTRVPRYVLPTDPASLQALPQIAMCLSPSPAIYGLTVGTVYCVKKFISYAVTQYTGYLNGSNLVKSIQFGCYVIALVLLGIRFMTLQTDFFMRDSMLFLIKLLVSIWLITHAATLYNTLTGAIGEGIGWVTSGLNLANEPDACFIMKAPKALLQAVDSTVNYTEYDVWHAFDCVLLRVFGITAAKPLASINTPLGGVVLYNSIPGLNMGNPPVADTGLPALISASMLTIIALAGGTIGLIILALGATFITLLLKTIMRTVFCVLSSYIVLSVMIIMIPLFAPLIIFQSHTDDSYTRKIFDRFINTTLGCVLHPIIMIGYLSFMFVCIDTFIEGDVSPIPAVQAVYSNCKPDVQVPPGSPPNICSFQQLFKTFAQLIGSFTGYVGATTADKATMFSDFSYITNLNKTLTAWKQVTDPQTASTDCKVINYKRSFITKSVVDQLNQVSAKSVGVEIPGPKSLKVSYLLLEQLAFLLVTLVIMMVVLSQILERLHEFIGGITQSAATGAMRFSSPLDGMLDSAKDGMISGMASAKSPGGMLGAFKNVPTKAFKGAEGAAKGILSSLGVRR